jgi:tetratricopeptide (TPR) repeat protein
MQESVRRVSAGDQFVQQGGDFAMALSEYEAAAAATPDDPDVWLRVGATRDQLGDAQGAQEAFDRARALSASDLDFYRARGAAYLALGLVEPAEGDLRQALELKYDDAQSWYLMANIFESRRQIAEAIDALDKAGQYASETDQSELTAMSRYRMGLLMQQLQFSPSTDAAPLTPTP